MTYGADIIQQSTHVTRCAAGVTRVRLPIYTCNAQICYSYVSFMVKHEILGLNIAMYDIFVV
jgi:hypothetical protein